MADANATTVPIVIESYGRLGGAARDWLRLAYHDAPQLRRSLLAQLAAAMQSHTSCMVLAAYGAPADSYRPGALRRAAAVA